ncbi:MAG: hypothetical protein ACHQHN_08975 [Sphingobacteriales bacterium]
MTVIKTISIPQPCRQLWQQMTIEKEGRHCAGCSKTVLDFTRMSNEEIISYLSTKTNVCGRIEQYQLAHINNTLPYQRPKGSWWKSALVIFSLLSAGSFKANSQSKVTVKMFRHKRKEDIGIKKPKNDGPSQKRVDSLEAKSLTLASPKILVDTNQVKSYSLEKELHCTASMGAMSVVSTTYNLSPQMVWIRVRKGFATRSELLIIDFVNSRSNF